MNTVHIMDFFDSKLHGDDKTPAVAAALERCRQIDGPATLLFPRGVHRFWPEQAAEREYWIANNDGGSKKITFPLTGFQGLTIDGGGSEFLFHGRVLPFVIDGSSDITIRDVTIDYDRPFHTHAAIVDAGADYVDLKIDKSIYPYRVAEGRLVFLGSNWESEEQAVMLMTEFDPATMAPAYGQGIYLAKFPQCTLSQGSVLDAMTRTIAAEEREDGIVRLRTEGSLGVLHKPGNWLTIGHERRLNPGFFIQHSQRIQLEDITLHHAGAMGVIAQLSADIGVRRLEIRLREGSGRVVSTNADATHFVHCTGEIELADCLFENMLDDATNVHGICTTVSRVIADDSLEVELQHYQQHGVNPFKPGDQINLVDRETLQPKQSAVIKTAELIDKSRIAITLESGLPEGTAAGAAVDNVSRMPEVVIRRCRTGRNRPRGFLVTTPGRTVIEDNVFYNSHCAIHITGDANYWFESGAVRDVTIRRNRFIDCCYAGGGGYPIVITPEIGRLEDGAACYHSGISVTDNDFESFSPGLLYARSVERLSFTGNRYRPTSSYVPADPDAQPVVLEACRDTVIEAAASLKADTTFSGQ